MLPDKITWGEKYDKVMKITTQEEADSYFEELVEWQMRMGGFSREEAINIEKQNIGYWGGYVDDEIRRRMEHLFKTKHPIFGSIATDPQPSPEEVFKMGYEMGCKMSGQEIHEEWLPQNWRGKDD